MTTKKEKLDNLPSTMGFTLSADDHIINMIVDNTRDTGSKKNAENIFNCLAMYATGTSLNNACKRTGLSYHTVSKWKPKAWFQEAITLLHDQLDDQLDNSLTAATHSAINYLQDRMDAGDTVMDKSGEWVKKPMSGRDLGVSFATLFDKRNLLRGKATSISESKTTDQSLDEIAKRFEDMATIDAEYEEIIDDGNTQGQAQNTTSH